MSEKRIVMITENTQVFETDREIICISGRSKPRVYPKGSIVVSKPWSDVWEGKDYNEMWIDEAMNASTTPETPAEEKKGE